MIYNENCLDTMSRMPDNHIDLVVTSPPYDNIRDYDGYADFDFHKTAKELYRIIQPGGIMVWVVGHSCKDGDESCTSFKQALHFREIGFRLFDTMIYQKQPQGAKGSNMGYWRTFEYMFVLSKNGIPKTINLITDKRNKYDNSYRTTKIRQASGEFKRRRINATSKYGKRTNVWKYSTGLYNSTKDRCAFEHPAIFPEKLAADHIRSWSNEGDLVYDPFAGSGTTLKMAMALNRRYIGSEINPKYYNIIRQRLKLDHAKMEQYT